MLLDNMDGSGTETMGMHVSGDMSVGSEATLEGDIPSCQGCRRRKLRCSREQPICSHCKRLGKLNPARKGVRLLTNFD